MALDDKTITQEEYDKVLKEANRLYNYLEKNKDHIIDYCYQCLLDMK